MRGLWSTLALVAVALGLGAYLYFGTPGETTDSTPKDRVFSVDSDKIQELRVTAGGETSTLKKVDGTWQMTAPVATEADATELTTLTTTLSTLERGRIVDENAADLAQFGLAEPALTVSFTADGGTTGSIAIGEKTPTQSDVYAVVPGTKKVFLVATSAESSFNRSPFDLRDKRILRFERDKADGLEVKTSAAASVMTRSGSDWRLTAPIASRADYAAIEGLLTRLATATMASIAAPEATDLTAYGLDTPAATVVVSSGSSRATLFIGREDAGKVYARDASRAMVFTVDASLATDLRKTPEEYRAKGLFEFRPYSATQITIVRGADRVTLEKRAGTGDAAAGTWTRAGATGTLDQTKVEDFLSQLSGLQALSFAPASENAGMASPLATIDARYDEKGLTEQVRIGRTAAGTFASRQGEPGFARIEATTLDAILTALDAAVAAPAPATPPAAPAADAAKKP